MAVRPRAPRPRAYARPSKLDGSRGSDRLSYMSTDDTGMEDDKRRCASSRPEGPAPIIDTRRESSGVACSAVEMVACDTRCDSGENARVEESIEQVKNTSEIMECIDCIVGVISFEVDSELMSRVGAGWCRGVVGCWCGSLWKVDDYRYLSVHKIVLCTLHELS